MFNKIKIRFIILSMSALLILLTAIIVSMNVINYRSVVEEADMLLSIMAENEGTFPKGIKKAPPFISQETPYEARYFSVVLNEQKRLLKIPALCRTPLWRNYTRAANW